MPLIIMVGIPCSGKTTRANQIKEFMQHHFSQVHLINEEVMNLDKFTYLSHSNQEKILRASLKSNVEKYLNVEHLVILDSMNYIKGFRYELYCLVRSAMTTFCVVWCDTSKDKAKQLCESIQNVNDNQEEEKVSEQNQQTKKNIFPIQLFEDYASRMEFPNPAKRWDQPLFQIRDNDEIDLDKILEALKDISKNKPKDPISTKAEQQFDENFMHELDKTCQIISNFIIQKQQEFSVGDSIVIPNCKIKYQINKIISPVEIKKIKKEFLNFSKLKPPKSKNYFSLSFVEFLNSSIERE